MLGILLLSIVLLVVLLAVAAQVALNTKTLDRIVQRFAAEYIDGEIRYDRLKLSLVKDFPNGRLRMENFSLVYPHERFDAYPVKNEEGRGVEVDTLQLLRGIRALEPALPEGEEDSPAGVAPPRAARFRPCL